jgi:hypothetical protein
MLLPKTRMLTSKLRKLLLLSESSQKYKSCTILILASYVLDALVRLQEYVKKFEK